MGKTTGATNTQKTIMLALYEGWLLRYTDVYGWCLFQVGRQRPFAKVKSRTVKAMTDEGWLSPGMATQGLGFYPRKSLTKHGEKYAERLARDEWAENYEWDPYDATHKLDVDDSFIRRAA